MPKGYPNAGRAAIRTENVDLPNYDGVKMELGRNENAEDRPEMALVDGESMDSPHLQDYIKILNFFEEEVTIIIHGTTDKNAEVRVSCGVNGEQRTFDREIEYKVKRKFLDALIKTETSYRLEQRLDNQGVQYTARIPVVAPKYQISVLHDPSGKFGRDWFAWQSKQPR